MDFESPVASKHHEDSDEEEFSSSELKESHLYKSLAESKRSSEDPILNYRDILTDQQALDFIKKHFSQNLIEVSFSVDTFIEVLLQEFFLRNPSVVSSIEDVKFFKKELKKLLKTSLTTNDDNCLSLNALEVNTKTKGLYNYVFDLAMEAQSMMKIKENNKINEAILEEFAAVSKMLQTKKQELIDYELRLKEFERSLLDKEDSMKHLLQSEYERLVKSFEESYNIKISGIQKRVLTNEKTTKAKLKVVETKMKEFKSSSSATSNNEDKLKYKIVSLEKTNEFLKLKTQDLEKKWTLEQEAKNQLAKKNEKLAQKITNLEKSINERSMMESVDKRKEADEKAHFASTSEKPLEVVDLNASHQKPIHEDDLGEEQDEFNPEESKPPVIAPKEEKTATATKKTSKVLTFDSSTAEAPKKKVVTSKTSSDETRVLLNVIHNMVISLKSTLPGMAHTNPKLRGSMPIEELLQTIDLKKNVQGQTPEEENDKFYDIGEIFYPCFNNLVGNLTELLPMLSKPYNVKHIFTLSELYYRLLDFFFKFKVQKKFQHYYPYLNEFDIQNSIHKVKTNQDHVNEIMNSSRIMEISFTPQTDYWKKIIKTSKPLHKNKTAADLQNSVLKSLNKENKAPNKPSADACLDLFSDEIVQKETTNLLKKYLDITEFMLRKDSQQENTITFQTSMNIETQKYLQMTRLYISLLVLMLSRNKKEQNQALTCLLNDLNTENSKVAEYLRQFLVENDGLDLILWHVEQAMDDFPTVQLITDILLTLNYNGNHYKHFIAQISQEHNINVKLIILDLVLKYRENNEFCEKMCVMFQRITYHNNLRGKIDQRYLKFFREKLNDIDILKNNEFFVTNVKSILLNLESA